MATDSLRSCLKKMESKKPYVAMILVQFIYSGMSLLSKAAITQGMNPCVFVVYRQGFAALALAPFACLLERKTAPALSFILLCKIALVSSWITLTLNLCYFALNYVSATFVSALANTIPAITFTLAICFGLEKLSIKQRHGVAKLIGSIISLSGALLCTFAKGPPLFSQTPKDLVHVSKQNYAKSDWVKGSLLLLASNTSWCFWLIMQAPLLKQYPATLRLTALQCFFSCVSSIIWCLVKHTRLEYWKLGWNLNLLSVFYCGVIVTAVTYWLQVWVLNKKGPVFTAVFGPLCLIITAIFSALFFQETLYWGSVCGAVLLVIGLYGILWGKGRERKKSEENKVPTQNLEGEREVF